MTSTFDLPSWPVLALVIGLLAFLAGEDGHILGRLILFTVILHLALRILFARFNSGLVEEFKSWVKAIGAYASGIAHGDLRILFKRPFAGMEAFNASWQGNVLSLWSLWLALLLATFLVW